MCQCSVIRVGNVGINIICRTVLVMSDMKARLTSRVVSPYTSYTSYTSGSSGGLVTRGITRSVELCNKSLAVRRCGEDDIAATTSHHLHQRSSALQTNSCTRGNLWLGATSVCPQLDTVTLVISYHYIIVCVCCMYELLIDI